MPLLLLVEVHAHWMVQMNDDLKQNFISLVVQPKPVSLSACLYTNSNPEPNANRSNRSKILFIVLHVTLPPFHLGCLYPSI